jgi:hypothetical protein
VVVSMAYNRPMAIEECDEIDIASPRSDRCIYTGGIGSINPTELDRFTKDEIYY